MGRNYDYMFESEHSAKCIYIFHVVKESFIVTEDIQRGRRLDHHDRGLYKFRYHIPTAML